MRSRIVFALGCMLGIVSEVAACGWDWTVVPKASGDAGSDAAIAEAGKDAADGPCQSSAECPSDQFCQFDDLLCGGGKPGVCAPKKCEPQPGSVCGCDGQVYSSDCKAYAAGVDITFKPCTAPPADAVRCGAYYCAVTTSFCAAKSSKDDSTKACIDWKCSEQTCACAREESGCPDAGCEQDGGGTTVVCQ